jgi:LysR family transcriptional regulator (chromosome initiation inhibitor)
MSRPHGRQAVLLKYSSQNCGSVSIAYVDVDVDQLRALAAAVEQGSLDAAARVLHVTPSAVSQRLRALEASTGQVLLVRSRPARPTPAGETLIRTARQVDLLLADAARELSPGGARPVLPIAVNADSLATWVLPALASIADEVLVDVRREDQTRTETLLRDGSVVAAVTTEARPVAGCRSTPLGAMRYRPTASPVLARRWFPDGVSAQALAHAPVVVFDRADDLQHAYLRRHRLDSMPPAHYVPSSADFLAAVLLGMGWGMLPDLQSAPYRESGALVELDPNSEADVELHWQRWALRTPALSALTDAVTDAARRALRAARSPTAG